MKKEKIDGWYKSGRNYLHFDEKVSFEKASRIVKNPRKVASWNFFPFLQTTVKTSKITRNDEGEIVPKNKSRPISYAAHTDSHIYSYYATLLQPIYEKFIEKHGLGTNITGFRKLDGECNIDFAHRAFNAIRSMTPCIALSFDVKSFFDEIDHSILKQAWCTILEKTLLPEDHFAIFKSLTTYSYVDRDDAFNAFWITKSSKKNGIRRICNPLEFRSILRPAGLIKRNKNSYGIPQGSPISGLLSNIYLFEFDKAISYFASDTKSHYYRYCDDIIIICNEEHEELFKNLVSDELKKLNLRTNEKNVIRKFFMGCDGPECDKPIQYLGFVFDGKRAVIRSASHSRFLKRMRKAVSLAKQTKRKRDKIRTSKGLETTSLHKKKLYTKYSYLGNRNYISYAHRAAKIMDEDAIKKQVKPLWKRLRQEIESD